jgi:L-asparaginase
MTLYIFTAGGTIDKVYFDARSEYTVGDPQIVDILRAAQVTFEWKVEAVVRKDSLELTDEDRAAITAAIHACPGRRILVTHGTDTMALTAKALEAGGEIGDKTVVFVGSLSPARFKASDAEFNIGFAVGVVQTMTPGVYVAMNGRVFPAATVRKNRAQNRFEGEALDD